jgi:hypothetical protein
VGGEARFDPAELHPPEATARRGGWPTNRRRIKAVLPALSSGRMDFYTLIALVIAVVIAAIIIWIIVPRRPRI